MDQVEQRGRMVPAAPGVKFVPLRPCLQKIRYGIAWRKEPSEALVHRFIEYTEEQLESPNDEELGER